MLIFQLPAAAVCTQINGQKILDKATKNLIIINAEPGAAGYASCTAGYPDASQKPDVAIPPNKPMIAATVALFVTNIVAKQMI